MRIPQTFDVVCYNDSDYDFSYLRGECMTLGLILVIVILIGALLATLLLSGKGDDEYSKAAKKNTMNLSLIYIVAILLSFLAVGIYIRWFV